MPSSINASNSGSGGLISTADASGVLQLQTAGVTAVTVDTSQNTTLAGYLNAPNTFGFKNRIINGAMMIDQRNAGASVTPTADGSYTLDRWTVRLSQTSKFSVQQNAGSVTPPTGYTNYLGVTSLSAYSLGASDFFGVQQNIEGFNIADLGWGASGGSPATLSFWVRSSLTGTFGCSLYNQSGSVSIPLTYTISIANTWQYVTVAIPSSSLTGTFTSTTNSLGISVFFNLGCGTSQSGGTPGTWSGTFARAPTGATSVVGTNGATFYITGVQLEKGSTATPFDYRPYGTELALCQRYYWKTPSSVTFVVNGGLYNSLQFKTSMRSTPTITATPQSGTTSDINANTEGFYCTTTVTAGINVVASAEL
jgi:hypothetical protein